MCGDKFFIMTHCCQFYSQRKIITEKQRAIESIVIAIYIWRICDMAEPLPKKQKRGPYRRYNRDPSIPVPRMTIWREKNTKRSTASISPGHNQISLQQSQRWVATRRSIYPQTSCHHQYSMHGQCTCLPYICILLALLQRDVC